MAIITPFKPRAIPGERQPVSETMIGRYKYTITTAHNRYWVACADTASNAQLDHGPMSEAQALEMIASRVRREEELKR